MWYGLKINGTLTSIKKFNRTPNLNNNDDFYMFGVSPIPTSDYELVLVNIDVTNTVQTSKASIEV